MATSGADGGQGCIRIADRLLAPSTFDLSQHIERALLEYQLEEDSAYPECLYGDLTDIDCSEASDGEVAKEDTAFSPEKHGIDQPSEYPECLFGDLTDIEDSEASDDAPERRPTDAPPGEGSYGMDQSGNGSGKILAPVCDEANVERKYVSQAEPARTQGSERKRNRKRRGRKKSGQRAEKSKANSRARLRHQIEMGRREGPAQKKFKRAEPIASKVRVGDLPRASSGWQGLQSLPKDAQDLIDAGSSPTLDELKGLGMEEIKWDGIKPKVIHDSKGNAVVVLVGRPDRAGYLESCKAAHDMLLAGRRQFYRRPARAYGHRRGWFPNPGGGFGMGGGSEKPNPVDLKPKALVVWWNETFESEPVQEVVRFTRVCMSAVCGSDLRNSDAILDEICRRDGDARLRRLKGSAFAAATLNLGEQAWTKPHRDMMNLACWFCSVTALGEYDYTKEGHLVLWELGMVIQFPPGSTIFLPSALLTHSNVPVLKGKRTSIVQYSAAGLYRYARCGHRTLATMRTKTPKEYWEFLQKQKDEAVEGLKFFKRVGEALGV